MPPVRAREIIDARGRSILSRRRAVYRRGRAVICRFAAVTGRCLTVSQRGRTVIPRSRLVAIALAVLGTDVPSIRLPVAALGYVVVQFASLVPVPRGPIAVLASLVRTGVIPRGACIMILLHVPEELKSTTPPSRLVMGFVAATACAGSVGCWNHRPTLPLVTAAPLVVRF